MEVSPNIDSNLDLDDGEVEEHETKLNRNKAKRRKKSINGKKLDVKMNWEGIIFLLFFPCLKVQSQV